MVGKTKIFVLGLLLGGCLAFPLGMNFGENEPLLSNPIARADLQEEVGERVKKGSESALEGARKKIHEATRPLVDPKESNSAVN